MTEYSQERIEQEKEIVDLVECYQDNIFDDVKGVVVDPVEKDPETYEFYVSHTENPRYNMERILPIVKFMSIYRNGEELRLDRAYDEDGPRKKDDGTWKNCYIRSKMIRDDYVRIKYLPIGELREYKTGEETDPKEQEFTIDYKIYTESPTEKKAAKTCIEELLERFENLFNTFVSLLKYGQINANMRKAITLVNLFLEGENDRNLARRGQFTEKFIEQVKILKYGLRNYSEEDLRSQMHQIFIEMVQKYVDTGKTFSSYAASFPYYLKTWVQKAINDYENLNSRLDQYEDEYTSGYIELDELEGTNTKQMDPYYKEPEIDEEWVAGTTARRGVFRELTKTERKVAKMRFKEEMNKETIAELLGMSTKELNTKLDSIREKLRDYLWG